MSVAKKSAKKSSTSKPTAKKGAAKKSSAPSKSAGKKSAPSKGPGKKSISAKPSSGAKKGSKAPKGSKGSKGAVLTKKTRVSLPPPAPDGVTLRKVASKKLALELVGAALEKKAERSEIIDVSERVDYADYVVLLSGRSDVQLGAIAQAVEDAVKKHNRHPSRDGRRGDAWIVLDCGDVWVHVFLEEARKYYDIEGFWSDAPRVDLPKDMIPKRTSLMPPPGEEDEVESEL
ncbi:MAG: ribosome silencing factor [Polyangiales bacterium]